MQNRITTDKCAAIPLLRFNPRFKNITKHAGQIFVNVGAYKPAYYQQI